MGIINQQTPAHSSPVSWVGDAYSPAWGFKKGASKLRVWLLKPLGEAIEVSNTLSRALLQHDGQSVHETWLNAQWIFCL